MLEKGLLNRDPLKDPIRKGGSAEERTPYHTEK